jgi:hypothetical protein
MRPNPTRSKNLRLNLAAATVLKLMRHGQSLHLEFCGGMGARWRLSGGSKVDDKVARRVIVNSAVVGGDDALFPDTTPQTWRICK